MAIKKAIIDLEVTIPDGAECYVDKVIVKYTDRPGEDVTVPAENQTAHVEWEESE